MTKQENINRFFEVLFSDMAGAANAHTSITDALRGKESTEVVSIFPHESRRVRERFCINTLYSDIDKNPTEFWHRANVARRADVNVSCFRNILVECDKVSIEDQVKWLNNSSLPYSAVVHSGDKSLHIFISLEEPLKSKQEYTRLCTKLYGAIAKEGLPIDESCKNPSRLSRYPGVIRSSTNKEQELLFVGDRVKNGILNTWINQHKPRDVKKLPKAKLNLTKKEAAERHISHTTNKLIKEHEYYTQSRHEAFKRAAVQLKTAGYDIDEIEEKLSDAYHAIIPERDELKSLLRWVDRNVQADLDT